jgi:hypothetical protein
MFIGGEIRMTLPYKPPLPIRRPASRAASRSCAAGPVAGALVSVSSSQSPYQDVTSDQNGNFTIKAVEGQDIYLHSYGSDGTRAEMTVTVAGQSDVVLTLKSEAPVD